MYKCQTQVNEFHTTFGYGSGDYANPKKMKHARRVFRARLIREEIREFVEANNIVDQADALADALYFLLGTADDMGIDLEPIFDIVHKCNMNKLGPDGKPIHREDGKILKPEGWTGPEEEIKTYFDNNPNNE